MTSNEVEYSSYVNNSKNYRFNVTLNNMPKQFYFNIARTHILQHVHFLLIYVNNNNNNSYINNNNNNNNNSYINNKRNNKDCKEQQNGTILAYLTIRFMLPF